MASDSMRVRLHLRETRVLAVASDTPSELRGEVESTVTRPRCPACGLGCVRVHDTRRRKVRDLEVSGHQAVFWRRALKASSPCSRRGRLREGCPGSNESERRAIAAELATRSLCPNGSTTLAVAVRWCVPRRAGALAGPRPGNASAATVSSAVLVMNAWCRHSGQSRRRGVGEAGSGARPARPRPSAPGAANRRRQQHT